ncbi:MAG: HAMP domain-containing histidine kinase [Proteobacteria bacterium]|nr:HAMP domain-containing histidine kinase [Pseudomonadota bacterium]MBU1387657.1 HAMP domain-containing histidine kinase [Pseudomonadota bacterium]MBU1543689.1 HAMP domain-containing histidine kinase [Pseudomonadota bacterium]MBU2482574.1 HAMP domain-containing histidine kinase [Pseudomonadota bacterium]
MDTYFAPAHRTERRKFQNQIANISHNPIMDSLLKAAAGLLVVLNEDRQIVAINPAFLKAMGAENIDAVLGFRLGETLHCVHASEKPHGCGTTEYCQTCGAAIAMMTAINDNQITEQTCALMSDKNGQIEDTCFLIKAIPLVQNTHRWILIYAQDITRQQFWTNLERVFFHDINNILTSVYGNIQLLEESDKNFAEIQAIHTGIERLIREIKVQKTISQRKQPDYSITRTDNTLEDIQKEIHTIIHGHHTCDGKNFIENWPQDNIRISTDRLLVSRVLGNMLINAFEASLPGQSVHLTVRVEDGCVLWEVFNPACIPPEIQKRIFQKHFTTKSQIGRGLGTYSMKLFGEKYLKGKVFFISSDEQGTVFTFKLPRV